MMKPTGREGTGHGRGLATLLAESWSKKHSLQPFLPEVSASKDKPPVKSQCCEKCFCHCGHSKEGAQAMFFQRKLVSLLRPFLFLKQQKKTEEEKQKKIKKPKLYTKARLHMMKGFLILRLEPKDPEADSVFHSDRQLAATGSAKPSGSGGWMKVAARVATQHDKDKDKNNLESQTCKQHLTPKPLWLHVSYCNYKTLEFTGLPLTGTIRNNGTDNAQAHLQAANPVSFYRSFEFFKETISFPHAYVASMWVIRADDSQIPQGRMTCRDLVATPFTTIPPFKTWKGERQETIDRKDAEDREKDKQRKRDSKKRKVPAKGLITHYSGFLKKRKTRETRGPSASGQSGQVETLEYPDSSGLDIGDDLPVAVEDDADLPEFLRQEQERLDHETDIGDEGEGEGSGAADHNDDDDDDNDNDAKDASDSSDGLDSASDSDSSSEDFGPGPGHDGIVLEAGAATSGDGQSFEPPGSDVAAAPVVPLDSSGDQPDSTADLSGVAASSTAAEASTSADAVASTSAGPRATARNPTPAADPASRTEAPPGCTLRMVGTAASPLWIGLLPPGKKFRGNKTKSRSFQHSSYQSSASSAAQRTSDEAKAEVLAWLWDWYNSDQS